MRSRFWIGLFMAAFAGVSGAAAQDLPSKEIEFRQNLRDFDDPPRWGYDPFNGRLLLGLERQGLFGSQDGGENWTRIDDGSYASTAADKPGLGPVVASPAKGVLFSLPYSQGFTPILYRSLDAGRSWQPFLDGNRQLNAPSKPSSTEVVTAQALRLYFVRGRPQSMYLLTSWPYMHEEGARWLGMRLWSSWDGGASFRRITNYPGPEFFYDIDVAAGRICVAFWQEHDSSLKTIINREAVLCRRDGGDTWREVAVAGPEVRKRTYYAFRIWTDNAGAFSVLAGDKLQVSTDDLKTFKSYALPSGPKELFLHPLDVYPAYLSVQESEDRHVVYRLDKDQSVTKLGAIKGRRILQVDFSQGLALAEDYKERRFYRVELR